MKIWFWFLLFVVACAFPAHAKADLPLRGFAQLPVQYDGRLQPLDSFARASLTAIAGKSHLENMPAVSWLAEILLNPDMAYRHAIFNVDNAQARQVLDLPDRTPHLYTFLEIATAMDQHRETIDSLLKAREKNIADPAQQQVLTLYDNMLRYFEISRSFSLLLPFFKINDLALAQKLAIPPDKAFSYLEMMQHKAAYLALMQPWLQKRQTQKIDSKNAELLHIGLQLEHMEIDKQSRIFRIIPGVASQNDAWHSPWDVFQSDQGSPQTAQLLQSWKIAATAYQRNDAAVWQAAIQDIANQDKATAKTQIRPHALQAEYFYNHAKIFIISAIFYLLALFFVMVYRLYPRQFLYLAAFISLICGFALHFVGIALRIYILARPPVGTLYESILFVGLITVAESLLLEMRGQKSFGLIIGALLGSVLQGIALTFAQGDTMEPLVAVLNTNFWLATHVIMITMGYACCLLTGILAHVYLLQRIVRPEQHEKAALTLRITLAAALIALFFSLVGTVLGGIWADQSWGRFWGWDPKENGALLIVLWLLSLLHARLAKLIRQDGFAIGAAATIMVVAVSWFGVNLLNVGLHSYGFTSGIALNLILFLCGEGVLIASCGFVLWRRQSSKAMTE